MEKLKNTFHTRSELISHVQKLCPWAQGNASSIKGGSLQAKAQLHTLDPIDYGKTRNYGSGSVSRLSPYITHGIIDLNTVRNHAIALCDQPTQAFKFIQELAWRDFWQQVAKHHPMWIWQDVEDYKTGFKASDYQNTLPEDIALAKTDCACINAFIKELIETGYIHNHSRMYLASYIVHFRRVKWQVGARWFLEHLLDGDEASNNFSWQWVASTFSHKPYIFNLENVDKYFGKLVDTQPKNNCTLDASYQSLSQRLFPNIGNH